MSNYEQSCLVFAARYAHTRNIISTAFIVINVILKNWDRLTILTQTQLKREAENEAENETIYNKNIWKLIINN